MSDPPSQEQQPPSASPPPRPHTYPFIPVKVVDGRPPFAPLATLHLTAVPRPGDGIRIDLAGRRIGYKVDFINFEPYDDTAHVTLGCSPSQPTTAVVQSDPAKISEFIQSQEQMFQKLEAYSRTIITLGYAGVFAIWAFVKDHLSHRAVLWTAMLVGFSLLVYIAWEVAMMIHRTTLQLRFNRTINDHPGDQAKAINDYLVQTRAQLARGAPIWMVIQILTVGPGFAGALLLIYNVFAELTGLPERP